MVQCSQGLYHSKEAASEAAMEKIADGCENVWIELPHLNYVNRSLKYMSLWVNYFEDIEVPEPHQSTDGIGEA